MAKVVKSVVIKAAPSRIWDLASDPSQWHTWFEGASQAKSIQGNGGVGTVVEHGITVNKIPLPAKTTVVTFDPTNCWKGEFTGPANRGYMQWDYLEMGPRTRLTFTIEAELSGPAKLAEKMVISSFESMAEKTLENVKQLSEA